MTELQNRTSLADKAKVLNDSFNLVYYNSTLFIPVHWSTLAPTDARTPQETIWLRLTSENLRVLVKNATDVLFANDSEFRNFEYMLKQLAVEPTDVPPRLLIRGDSEIFQLTEQGQLVPHDGTFIPNYIPIRLNTDRTARREVKAVLTDWLGGDEESVTSLLHHLATALAPAYSAVKYVLLLGDGRNGKSTLLNMLTTLFGPENISSVTRQSIAVLNSTCLDLNNTLLNIVYDGSPEYIKDSGSEKALVAGEPVMVRRLYESTATRVATNALFIEGLNQEPKSRDKSSALQKRLVRFQFPNVYALDPVFGRRMLSDEILGAFLDLLLDHFVVESELAERLAPTKRSEELQIEQTWLNAPLLQFIAHLLETEPKAVEELRSGKMFLSYFFTGFKPWLEQQHHREIDEASLIQMAKTYFTLGWKTKRVGGKPVNERYIKALKPDTLATLEFLTSRKENDVSFSIETDEPELVSKRPPVQSQGDPAGSAPEEPESPWASGVGSCVC